MKRLLIAGFLLAAPSVVSAQRDDQFVFGLGGGATLVSGLAKDNHDPGAHGTLSWGIGMTNSPWGIRFDGMYSSLGSVPATQSTLGSAKVFVLSGNAIFNIYGSNTHLYGIGGIGGHWYNPKGSGSASKNDLTLQAGLGVYLPWIHGFVETKFMNLYRALPNPDTGVNGKRSAKLYPVTLGILF